MRTRKPLTRRERRMVADLRAALKTFEGLLADKPIVDGGGLAWLHSDSVKTEALRARQKLLKYAKK